MVCRLQFFGGCVEVFLLVYGNVRVLGTIFVTSVPSSRSLSCQSDFLSSGEIGGAVLKFWFFEEGGGDDNGVDQ